MKNEETVLDTWQKQTDRVSAGVFDRYFRDGNTRRLAALRRLEDAFDKVLREVRETTVGDVEIRTSYVDHNSYLIDFTTAFEVRVGKWRLYHTGDCGTGSEPKLRACRPDLWVFFPGCGIDVEAAVRRVRPKSLAFGHLWELGHKSGRLTAPLLRNAFAAARRAGADPVLALWGDRLS